MGAWIGELVGGNDGEIGECHLSDDSWFNTSNGWAQSCRTVNSRQIKQYSSRVGLGHLYIMMYDPAIRPRQRVDGVRFVVRDITALPDMERHSASAVLKGVE
jgi:hypothetical protein